VAKSTAKSGAVSCRDLNCSLGGLDFKSEVLFVLPPKLEMNRVFDDEPQALKGQRFQQTLPCKNSAQCRDKRAVGGLVVKHSRKLVKVKVKL